MPRLFVEKVLVLGKTELASAVIAELKKRSRYRVLEDLEPAKSPRILKHGLALLGPPDPQWPASEQPHRIVVALLERRGRVPIDALLEAKRKGIVIEEALQVYERLTGKLALDRVYPSHLIYSNGLRRYSIHCALQRVMSVVLSAVGLILCAPLLAAIALLVKLDSPGPVLFVQERIGRNGKRFLLWKFRTMHPVAERTSEWVKDNGARITRVGRWLRKFRLDEVPQLFNVLRGHMNLVGPRPHPASNYALFMDRIPFYAFRSMVPPGVTGWAQVRYGYANNLEEETEKMCYDLYYIKYSSLWLDLRILLKTIKVVILGLESRQPSLEPTHTPRPNDNTERRLDAA
jgi:exopolysaccharide biosynthesis polyprenyl glycosylphosphotransferase